MDRFHLATVRGAGASGLVDAPPERPILRRSAMTPDQLRIEVDRDRCVGNGICLELAPGVFEHDEKGRAEVVDPEGDTVDDIIEAAANCPTGAIRILDATSGEILYP